MISVANKNASEEARKLVQFLYDCAGKKIITGQHTQTNPMEEISYIKSVTGHEPFLRGFELLGYSPNINYDDADEACLIEVEENKGTAETALAWAKENNASDIKCMLTFSFHWFSPVGGRDKSFYAKNTDFDPEKVLVDGSPENRAFYSDMDHISEILEKFKQEKIPILWRPFHESYGTWFWWGRKGPEVACKLYRMMFDYYVYEKHLDNLVWVWNCDVASAYPGDEYVDVNSIDVYLEEKKATDYKTEYEKLVGACGKNKVCALAEVGYNPDVDLVEVSKVPWAYYMTWSKEFAMDGVRNTKDELSHMYSSDYSVKL
ncbi:glycosyl hydrolase [Treponema sp.]|uniref:glycosyl hydrolase n=1 Tax=Treponema sp. TaxID=166 RepID=UPI00298E93BF|nr:glycosyl hydrolase [Treponema sp.]MCQ2242504.1 glycoside hydrolase family 26 protein [Treponema sp.]